MGSTGYYYNIYDDDMMMCGEILSFWGQKLKKKKLLFNENPIIAILVGSTHFCIF